MKDENEKHFAFITFNRKIFFASLERKMKVQKQIRKQTNNNKNAINLIDLKTDYR